MALGRFRPWGRTSDQGAETAPTVQADVAWRGVYAGLAALCSLVPGTTEGADGKSEQAQRMQGRPSLLLLLLVAPPGRVRLSRAQSQRRSSVGAACEDAFLWSRRLSAGTRARSSRRLSRRAALQPPPTYCSSAETRGAAFRRTPRCFHGLAAGYGVLGLAASLAALSAALSFLSWARQSSRAVLI